MRAFTRRRAALLGAAGIAGPATLGATAAPAVTWTDYGGVQRAVVRRWAAYVQGRTWPGGFTGWEYSFTTLGEDCTLGRHAEETEAKRLAAQILAAVPCAELVEVGYVEFVRGAPGAETVLLERPNLRLFPHLRSAFA